MKNPKYNIIVKTSKELFWKYGIKRVTVEEICKEAGVSKMTFYKFFPNKSELAKFVWKSVVSESLNKFKNVVNSDLSFQDKIREMFTIKLQAAEDISVEFINDVYKIPDLGLQPQIEKYGQKTLQIFVNFIKNSQKTGLIRKDVKVEFIMHYFNQMSSIFDNLELVDQYDHPHDLIMESMNFMFYGLLPKK